VSRRRTTVTSPGRTHEILAALITEASTGGRTMPAVLCQMCARDLPITGAAIVLHSSAGLDRMVAATAGLAAAVEALQFELGEGPGVDAMRQDGPVLRSDLEAATGRWPLFAPAALHAGAKAAFALPLQVGGIRLGVLDLYRDSVGPLLDGVLAEALAFAGAATSVLLHLQSLARPGHDLHPELTGFTADRAEIHQATGMISVQAGVTLVEALLLLRARAFATNSTMLDVSRDVLLRRLNFGTETEASTE
jgi:hypothetical protein